MSTALSDLDQFRAEIARLLDSPEFSSSRHLQEFLRYTSEKALSGSTHLEQAEIAAAVLGRGAEFNPVEDASVRKLASQVRQRLEQYYGRQASAHDVTVVLPVRSYIPQFKIRKAEVPTEERAPVPEPLPRPRRVRFAVPVILILATASVIAFLTISSPSVSATPTFILSTVKGDIIQGGNMAPGEGVRLGPQLRDVDELTTRLDFSPSKEAQQAGLIVWQDDHHFVRLGRKFFGRNQIEFLVEEGSKAVTTPANTVYDGEGQSGQPLWLSIHRDGNQYRAFTSRDGLRWDQHGDPITPLTPFAQPRAGIFALNGRRDAPSIRASFSHLSTGVTFSNDAYTRPPWTVTRTCPDRTTASVEGLALRIAFTPSSGDCNFEIHRPLAGTEWEVITRMDFMPIPGRSAGLRVAGSKTAIRLVRYSLNGPSIAFIHDGRTLIGRPDFNGSPTVYLRLRAAGGKITPSYSADGDNFEALSSGVGIDELGTNLRGGIRFSTTTTDQEEPSWPARFFWYRESVGGLANYR